MEWHPIETAPKNGTLVLLVQKRSASPFFGYFVAYWDDESDEWKFHIEGYVREPTHWMPLPAPPKEAA